MNYFPAKEVILSREKHILLGRGAGCWETPRVCSGLCREKVTPPAPQFPLLHWTGAGAVSLDGTSESAGVLLTHRPHPVGQRRGQENAFLPSSRCCWW